MDFKAACWAEFTACGKADAHGTSMDRTRIEDWRRSLITVAAFRNTTPRGFSWKNSFKPKKKPGHPEDSRAVLIKWFGTPAN